MFYFLIIVGICLIFYGKGLLKNWREHRRRKELSSKIPGDEGVPIFGNLFELGRTSETMPRNILQRARETREKWDSELLKFWVMHECVFIPLNGEMLQYIIESTDEINKGEDYDLFEPWLGRGLLLASGDKWRSRRKLLTPTFHFMMLQNYMETMNSHAKVLLNVLESNIGREFDIYPFMKRCTLDTICDTAMGKDLDSLHHPDQPYAIAIARIMALGMDASMLPHLWSKLGKRVFGWQSEFDANIKIAHDFTNQVIEERLQSQQDEDEDSGSKQKRAFLDMLLHEKERSNLSMEDIREEVDTFMFAGHDTTSSALGWTIWCLANHPEMQDRVYQELKEVFEGDMYRDIGKDDLAKLSYLDRCIKESMRLFPPVPFTIRHLKEDLQMGRHLVPAGSSLMIAPYLVHHNERIYPQPEVYDPDRFLPENNAARHPYDYIPFSAGPRNCIGQKFASYQLRVILITLLRRFTFRSERDFPSIPRLAEVVLKAGGGVNVIIEERV